jgi:hypothetical protein
VAQPGATDDVQLWAAWAPDSAHYARAYDPSNSIVVSAPEGVQVPLPTLTPYELVSRGQLVVGGWLDDRTLLVTYESLEQPSPRTLQVYRWTIGDGSWQARGGLTFPDELSLIPVTAVSPDGRTLAVAASDAREVYDSAVATWDLGALSVSGQPVAARVQLLHSRSSVDGITFRRDTPLLTVSGRTGPVAGAPIPLALLGVWLLWRGALWVARRLGIVDGPLPLRFDPAWWRR